VGFIELRSWRHKRPSGQSAFERAVVKWTRSLNSHTGPLHMNGRTPRPTHVSTRLRAKQLQKIDSSCADGGVHTWSSLPAATAAGFLFGLSLSCRPEAFVSHRAIFVGFRHSAPTTSPPTKTASSLPALEPPQPKRPQAQLQPSSAPHGAPLTTRLILLLSWFKFR
jgi:hypothetical protein